jgi:hypothetical protein
MTFHASCFGHRHMPCHCTCACSSPCWVASSRSKVVIGSTMTMDHTADMTCRSGLQRIPRTPRHVEATPLVLPSNPGEGQRSPGVYAWRRPRSRGVLHAPRGWAGSAHLPSGCRMLLSARPGAVGAIRYGWSRYSVSQPVQAGTSCVGGSVAKVQKHKAPCCRAQARPVPTDNNLTPTLPETPFSLADNDSNQRTQWTAA